MPTRVVRDDDEQIIADLIKNVRRLQARHATQVPIWLPSNSYDPDVFTLTGSGDDTHTLTYLPLGLNAVTLNGLQQSYGTDFTVDWDTGTLTLLGTLATGDVLEVWYVTTGELKAASLPPEVDTMQWAGTANNDQLGTVPYPAESWGMSGRTAGKRIAGVWTNTSISDVMDEGVADAYSAEATVTSVPADHPVYFNWHACTVPEVATASGIVLQTDKSSMTLYLYRFGSAVLSVSAGAAPTVGDDIKLVTDFSTKVATATKNGVTIATINFASETWFVAGGAP